MKPFSQSTLASICAAVVAGAVCSTGTTLSAQQRITFSVDYQSSQVSVVTPCGGVQVTESDLLSNAGGIPAIGPVATPCINFSGGPGAGGLGIATQPGCVGLPAFTPCGGELDAVSFGIDSLTTPNGGTRWWFSVDENAIGSAGILPGANVTTEGANGALEASADVFCNANNMPPGPINPAGAFGANAGAIDGNGMISSTERKYIGLGLLEPNLVGAPPHPGDNLDALDLEGPFSGLPRIYFSLDGNFIDPKSGLPNTNSANANGFASGGDILVTTPGGVPGLYAPAAVLGLDFFGPGTDDIDALVMRENGAGGYQPPSPNYSWANSTPTDMVFFSVRRGSACIGQPDSIFGMPIEEGDILIPRPPLSLNPFPGIWIPAESLGLATARTGAPCGDDLNALDEVNAPFFDCDFDFMEDSVAIAQGFVPDCNRNGIPDSCDIASLTSCDSDLNGIPDECDWGIPNTYCTAKVSSLGVGCVPFIDWHGTPSTTCPRPFEVNAGNILNFRNGLCFYGFNSAAIPFLGGTLCVQPPLRRTPIQNSGGSFLFGNCTGNFTFDFNAWIQSGIDPFLVSGATVYAQYWARDPLNTFNSGLSNAVRFLICP